MNPKIFCWKKQLLEKRCKGSEKNQKPKTKSEKFKLQHPYLAKTYY